MMVNRLLFLPLCLWVTMATAQDLDGFWKGQLGMQGCFPENNIELQLTISNGKVIGYSYHYLDVDNYVKKKLTGIYDAAQKMVVLQEGLVTTYHIPQRCVICIKKLELLYTREGDKETLSGQWGGHVQNSATDCGIGPIVLTRTRVSAFREVPEIRVDTGTIRLDFYDNAEVDGDSITIRINNQTILTHQRLSAKPITAYIRVDASNPFHEVEMIAENEGSIPPNTAVLIITAGKKRYQISLHSTSEKSARVRFVYEPDSAEDATSTMLSARLGQHP